MYGICVAVLLLCYCCAVGRGMILCRYICACKHTCKCKCSTAHECASLDLFPLLRVTSTLLHFSLRLHVTQWITYPAAALFTCCQTDGISPVLQFHKCRCDGRRAQKRQTRVMTTMIMPQTADEKRCHAITHTQSCTHIARKVLYTHVCICASMYISMRGFV